MIYQTLTIRYTTTIETEKNHTDQHSNNEYMN